MYLVLDPNNRSSLAVVRSLGKSGKQITVASSKPQSLAGSSRYCTQEILCPDIHRSPQEFVRWLVRHVDEERYLAVLPTTDASLELVLRAENELRDNTILPTVDYSTFEWASDKYRLMKLAQSLDVKVPQTIEGAVADLRPELLSEESFPVAVKGTRSNHHAPDQLSRISVRYAGNREELGDLLLVMRRTYGDDLRLMIQQKVVGEGVGYFALCHDGEVLADFSHRRILEKPPSGGVSVLCESIPPLQAPVAESKRLLRALNWKGVAMVEFKRHHDGHCYLMEINPRFWGSLQLAIDCGRDFPRYLVDWALADSRGGLSQFISQLQVLPPYREHHRLRWTLGTIDHAVSRIKKNGIGALAGVLLKNDLHFFRATSGTSAETFRWDDPKPFFTECSQWLRALFR